MGPRGTIVATILFVVLTIGVLAGSLWWIDSLGSSASPADTAKVVGAVVALVGTLFTGAVTFFGLLLKHSVDRRITELQRLESERNEQARRASEDLSRLELELKEEAEKRLKLEAEHERGLRERAEERLNVEALVRALELPSSGADSKASANQGAKALMALVELGRMGLALRLLKQLWPEDRVDSSTAVWVIQKALESGAPTDQEDAAELLRACAAKLPDGRGGFDWLSPPERWRPELSRSARDSILQALLRCYLSRARDHWDERYLVGAALPLSDLIETDDETFLQAGAILALEQLLKAHEHEGVIEHGSRSVDLDMLRDQVRDRCQRAKSQASPHHLELAEQLRVWVSGDAAGDPKPQG